MTARSEQVLAFRAMHRPGAGFVIPNAWDGGSARLLEQAGFPVLATTSAGIAWSRGLPDGTLTAADMLEAVERIVSVVGCPVSADLESGYGDVAATVSAALGVGVVGGNLEDSDASGLLDAEEALEHLQAARSVAPPEAFVLNARVDPYMVGHPDALAESINRAQRYLEAGADCIFVPGVSDTADIARLVAEIGAPVNVVAGLAGPVLDAATLRSLGVARISVGGTLTRAALTLIEAAGREMADHGTFGFAEGALPYREVQARLQG